MKFGFSFFMGTAATLALVSPAVHAKVDTEFSGHARTRMVFEDNTAGTDSNAVERWDNRVRANMDFMPASGLKVRLAPQFTHVWGDVATNDSFKAKEAWMMYSPNDMLSLWVGRQAVSFGNELILGTNSWAQDSTVHDVVKGVFTLDMGIAGVWYAKNQEGTTTGAADSRDNDHFGIYLSFDKLDAVKVLDLYAIWWDQRSAAATSKARFGTFGARVAKDFDAIDFGAEATVNFGNKAIGAAYESFKGMAMDVAVGYNWNDHRVGLGLVYANSEYEEIAPTTHRATLRSHRYMGDADFFTRENGNLYALSLVSNFALNQEFEASVDGYYFMAAKSDLGSANGKTIADESALGMEADFALAYMPMDNIAFQAGYALFKPGSALDDAALGVNQKKETAHKAYLQGTLKF